jgi:hypothetical protein
MRLRPNVNLSSLDTKSNILVLRTTTISLVRSRLVLVAHKSPHCFGFPVAVHGPPAWCSVWLDRGARKRHCVRAGQVQRNTEKVSYRRKVRTLMEVLERSMQETASNILMR